MQRRYFQYVDPEAGFTSSVIKDPRRFVGRQGLISQAVRAVNARSALISVYGKRGVGKSSLLRQIQNIATGDYGIANRAGIAHLVPRRPRRYYTIFYTCDSTIRDHNILLNRLCSDTDENDGLLRLVPDKGKELVEFTRSSESSAGCDLKLIKWGEKGSDSGRYASNIETDIVQTFRNFCASILQHNNRLWEKRDGVLIFLDEFDVVQDKSNIGSIIKSLSTDTLKFAICGIGSDITTLVRDHASVERLVEQGTAHVFPMSAEEIEQIFETAEQLFQGVVRFDRNVVDQIANISDGYPYFAQLIGKACVEVANEDGTDEINMDVYGKVLARIHNGTAFPSLEARYKRAVGESDGRAVILTLLAEQTRS